MKEIITIKIPILNLFISNVIFIFLLPNIKAANKAGKIKNVHYFSLTNLPKKPKKVYEKKVSLYHKWNWKFDIKKSNVVYPNNSLKKKKITVIKIKE